MVKQLIRKVLKVGVAFQSLGFLVDVLKYCFSTQVSLGSEFESVRRNLF